MRRLSVGIYFFLIHGFAVSLHIPSGFAVEWADVMAPASERFANRDTPAVPHFQKHVVPLLGRLGCNSAKCHGSFQGQGNFQLSLFGFDFLADHSALTNKASSEQEARIDLTEPDQSLVSLKPSGDEPHEGGQRFNVGSWEQHLLLRWIESGAHVDLTASNPDPKPNLASDVEREFFLTEVKPLLEDHCYECHGYQNKKGGLSLRNRNDLLQGSDNGRVINLEEPDRSLILSVINSENPDRQMPPSGKLPAEKLQILEDWVMMGAPWAEDGEAPSRTNALQLQKLHCEPSELVFDEGDQPVKLRVIAEWEDGTLEDVTCLARYQTNDDSVVSITKDGMANFTGEGDTHIVIYYDNGVAAIPVIRPYLRQGASPRSNAETPKHPIDQYIQAKLEKLGLQSSSTCSETEFLRRLSIDLTGTLPSPDEIAKYLQDPSPDKRLRKIDELLNTTSYTAWWTNKLCDFTGCNPKSISSLLEEAREEGYVKASRWYDWIFQQVEANQPYDQIVQGLMLAELDGSNESMPYFWQRQSLKEPKDTAMSVAHAFLGIQLQCAECHKHPFDQWTQADFTDFSEFFKPVTQSKNRSVATAKAELTLLRTEKITLNPGDDPRQPVMNWMAKTSNPWFARAFVNRVWASYFHRGIVDPPDQFTPANPPTHPELLNWLANGFVENGFDMKWLHRQITSSQTYQRSWKPNQTNRLDTRNFSRFVPRRIPAEVVYDAIKQVTVESGRHDEVRENLRRRASGHLSMRMTGTHAMKVFGKPDRSINCDCERVNEPTLLQAIFTQNDPLIRMRIADSGWIFEIEEAVENQQDLDRDGLVTEVWLRTVGRYPTDIERARAAKHLQETDDLPEAVSDLLWALINGKEFLLNH